MKIEGLQADELRVGTISVNYLSQTVKIEARAALIDTRTGESPAWSEGGAHLWSKETIAAVTALRESMERDFVRYLSGTDEVKSTSSGLKTEKGLGEHIGTVDDAPSI